MHPFSKEKARPLGRSDLDASERHPLRSKIAVVMAGQDVSRSCDFSCPALFSAVIDVPIARTLSSKVAPAQADYATAFASFSKGMDARALMHDNAETLLQASGINLLDGHLT